MQLRDRQQIQPPSKLANEDGSQNSADPAARHVTSCTTLRPVSSPFNTALSPAVFPTLEQPTIADSPSSDLASVAPATHVAGGSAFGTPSIRPNENIIPLSSTQGFRTERACGAATDYCKPLLHPHLQLLQRHMHEMVPEVKWDDLAPAVQIALYDAALNSERLGEHAEVQNAFGLDQKQVANFQKLYAECYERETEEEKETLNFLRAHLVNGERTCDELLTQHHLSAFSKRSIEFNFSTMDDIQEARLFLMQKKLPIELAQAWTYVSPGKSTHQPTTQCHDFQGDEKGSYSLKSGPTKSGSREVEVNQSQLRVDAAAPTNERTNATEYLGNESHTIGRRRRRGRPRKASIERMKMLERQGGFVPSALGEAGAQETVRMNTAIVGNTGSNRAKHVPTTISGNDSYSLVPRSSEGHGHDTAKSSQSYPKQPLFGSVEDEACTLRTTFSNRPMTYTSSQPPCSPSSSHGERDVRIGTSALIGVCDSKKVAKSPYMEHDRQRRQSPEASSSESVTRRRGGKAWRKGIRGSVTFASEQTKPGAPG